MSLQWSAGPSLPAKVHSPAVVTDKSSGTTIYCAGGYSSSGEVTDAVYTLSTPDGTSWDTGTSLPVALADAVAAVSDNLYVIGGWDGTNILDTVYWLDDGTWSSATSLPIPLDHAAAVTLSDGTIYVIGGETTDNRAVANVYTLAEGDAGWGDAPSLPSRRVGSAAAVDANDTIWLIGGVTHTGAVIDSVFYLESGASEWKAAPTLPAAVAYASAAVGYDGSVYVFGGEDGNPVTSVYQLPRGAFNAAWGTINPLPAALTKSGAVVPDGITFYLVGGFNGTAAVDSVYTAPSTSAPAAPILVSPVAGTYVDVPTSGDVTFTAAYNPTDGAQANARAMRIKSVGGSYQYWNASTGALQSTEVWNVVSIDPGTDGSFDVAGLSNGTTYNWSMADQESLSNLQGPYASDAVLNAQSGPALTVNEPTGTAITAKPRVTWTATPASGSSITYYQVKVFTQDQTEASGFDPSSSTAVWDSGSTAAFGPSQVTVGTALTTGVTYAFYVQVTETGDQTSSWVYSTATISVDAPADPTITASLGTGPNGLPVIELVVSGNDNLLPTDDASFESSVGTWKANTDWTISRDTSGHALDGESSLKCERTSTGAGINGAAKCAKVDVTAGATYTAMVWILPTTTGDDQTTGLQYQLRVLDGGDDSLVTSKAVVLGTDWTQLAVTFTAPTDASVWLEVTDNPQGSPAVGQTIYIDEAGIFPGDVTTWTRGGLVGLAEIVITRSDGVEVRGASAANPAPMPNSQTLTVLDAELIPTVDYSWTAVATIPVSSTQTLVSDGVSTDTLSIPGAGGWWEFDPTDLSTAVAAQVTAYSPQVTEQATAHLVLGQVTPNVIASVMGGVDGTATFETFDADTYQGLTTLLLSQRTIFVSDPFGDNQGVTYVRFGPETGGLSTGSGLKAKSANLQPSASSAPHHTIEVTWVAQPRPAV